MDWNSAFYSHLFLHILISPCLFLFPSVSFSSHALYSLTSTLCLQCFFPAQFAIVVVKSIFSLFGRNLKRFQLIFRSTHPPKWPSPFVPLVSLSFLHLPPPFSTFPHIVPRISRSNSSDKLRAVFCETMSFSIISGICLSWYRPSYVALAAAVDHWLCVCVSCNIIGLSEAPNRIISR